MFYDLHRHDQFSLFDGYGKARDTVKRAVQLGYPALGIANHGNVSGLVQHYQECIKQGIKPMLGCEVYFQPKFDKDKQSYHLCLFVRNLEGWHNLMSIIEESNRENFYKTPKTTFELLEKHKEGLICTSACVAGPLSQAIKNDNKKLLKKYMQKFKSIFGKHFYIEIMPYNLGEKVKYASKKHDLQYKINSILVRYAQKSKTPCILTSDSHYIKKKEFDTYMVMHAIGNSKIGAGYKERYMPSQKEIVSRLRYMHNLDAKEFLCNMHKLNESVDGGDWLKFEPVIPKYTDSAKDSYAKLKNMCIEKLKELKLFGRESYRKRLKKELRVINYHGFQDYFLIVQDYVNWAKQNSIAVGPGRGSAGNSLITFLTGITEIDAVYFQNDFARFMRKSRKSIPDIDVDFCTHNRDRVIEYILCKYKGKAAQVTNYGIYKARNLVNDLGRVFELEKEEILTFKNEILNYCDEKEKTVDISGVKRNVELNKLNKEYNGIVKHFCGLFGQIRYFGKHAGAVCISNTELSNHAGIRKQKGSFVTSFDMGDMEALGVVKFDILGVKTVSKIQELEKQTNSKFRPEAINNKYIYANFSQGKTDGIFQFESSTAKGILQDIECDNIMDVVACTALNRPAPLQMGIHDQYRAAKLGQSRNKKEKLYYKYTKDSYGTILYQEHVMNICRHIGRMAWEDVDKIMKFKLKYEEIDKYKKRFIKGALKSGMEKGEAGELFDKMSLYLFNKGHGVAYSLISVKQMYYKTFYPLEFWTTALKYADKAKRWQYISSAIKDGCLLMTPHVNGFAYDTISKLQGEKFIWQGLISLANVGEKAAQAIEDERYSNGNYVSKKDFLGRVPKRTVNKRVVEMLQTNGALEFNKKKYYSRVMQFNSIMKNKQY